MVSPPILLALIHLWLLFFNEELDDVIINHCSHDNETFEIIMELRKFTNGNSLQSFLIEESSLIKWSISEAVIVK